MKVRGQKLKHKSHLSSIVFLLSSLISHLSYAGWYGGELLSLGVGGRACGMGGAYAAIADDGFSSWWNPAGIVKNQSPFIAAMHSSPFGLFNFDFIGIGYPKGKLGISISFATLAIDSFPRLPEFDDDPVSEPIGYFSDQEEVWMLSCAYEYRKNMRLGLNIKHLRYKLDDKHGKGWGADIGISSKWRDLLIGLVAQDMGRTAVTWNTEQKDFKRGNLILGTAYCWKTFIFSTDLEYQYKFLYRIGVEYSFMNILWLRGGWKDNFTGGIGIRVKEIGIDCAFSTHQELGITYQISASLTI